MRSKDRLWVKDVGSVASPSLAEYAPLGESRAGSEADSWREQPFSPAPPEQLTTGGKAMRYQPAWSADGQRIAFGDKDGVLPLAAHRGRSGRQGPETTFWPSTARS